MTATGVGPGPVGTADLGDVRLARSADGLLGLFNTAGVLDPADVHVATRIGRLGGEAVAERSEDPRRRVAVVMLVVLDRLGLDPDAEARDQVVEVRAVLVLLGLAEHDQPAAGLDEGLDRLDLPGLEQR